ncbi:hypothetical protein AFK68_27665 [Hydrocoleum sp. CS-953]|uniref:hypothetical protein n=1 Tax=Hydrocoleum sp. CS-953 TaxID=1671698 RepID=UPI000BC59127|nr:hypothetical protein [Hydrocoleum sp. CS-953]OZH51934.1 hypothetical protein AFK68_27665 [Hydrocoleum sp. CS-953]
MIFPDIQSRTVLTRDNYQLSIINYQLMKVFYPDAPPQTYMIDTLLINSLFKGLELTAEQVFNKAGIPTTSQ